jgi:hypothetical protein
MSGCGTTVWTGRELQAEMSNGWNLVNLERIKWEGPDALSPGRHTIEFDFKYEGIGVGTLEYNNFSGLGRPGTGTLKVDGKEVAIKRMEKTLRPGRFQPRRPACPQGQGGHTSDAPVDRP